MQKDTLKNMMYDKATERMENHFAQTSLFQEVWYEQKTWSAGDKVSDTLKIALYDVLTAC